MTLSRRQKIIVWAWIAAIVLAGLFPPFATLQGYNRGFHPLFASPQYLKISFGPLVIEWGLATVVAVGCLLAGPAVR